jgi:hypothetical protein
MIDDKGLLINKSENGPAGRFESLKVVPGELFSKDSWVELNPHKVKRLCEEYERLKESGELSGGERASPVPERFRVRVITSLTWLIADARYRFDECKNNLDNGSSPGSAGPSRRVADAAGTPRPDGGGYGPDLTEAIELLDELKKGAIGADKDEQIDERLKAGVLSLSEAKEKHKEEINGLDEIIKAERHHAGNTLASAYEKGFEDCKKQILSQVQKLAKRVIKMGQEPL